MKTLAGLLILTLGFSQLTQAEEIVGLKFSDIQKIVAKAVVSKEHSLGIRASAKDVTDFELNFVRENEVEFSAIAPGYEKEDGIPNYCSVVLSRADLNSDYVIKSVDCSPLD